MGYSDIVNILISELFRDFTACGPNHEYLAYHPKVRLDATKDIKDLPYVIPDRCYHPEIYASIDFTYAFTVNVETPKRKGQTKKIEGKPLVSKATLKRTTKQLLDFISYYFEYAKSYEVSEDRSSRIDMFNRVANSLINTDDDFEKSLFINKVLNMFVNSFTVMRAKNAIGTCSVVFRDNPKFSGAGSRTLLFMDRAFSILSQVFVPQLPIMIWAKGRIYKEWYFPIFHGYLTRIVPGDSQGFTTITVEAKDILELARVTHEMINPALIQVEDIVTQKVLNYFEKPLYGLDHMKIFHGMFHGGGLKYDPIKGRIIDIDLAKDNPKKGYYGFTALGNFSS